MFIKTLLITHFLFSISFRNSVIYNYFDREYSFGGYNNNLNFEIEYEKQNNIRYFYQELNYKYDLKNKYNFNLKYLNNEEDKIHFLNADLSKYLNKYLNIGAGFSFNRENLFLFSKLNLKHKNILDINYLQYKNKNSIECLLKTKYKINDKLAIVPKFKYFIYDKKENWQGKIYLEYKLNSKKKEKCEK